MVRREQVLCLDRGDGRLAIEVAEHWCEGSCIRADQVVLEYSSTVHVCAHRLLKASSDLRMWGSSVGLTVER